uniref:Transforming growth factor-beta receptor-associated protein 1 isoform X2 n=1 Tax=Geotrypetes seraphini TaxID=260995 RepID=A0A6P8R1H3_GEOSA|nr:transforming growth factor-beta receptor-associated protein 1 isoform X2 [Geotrypetes seraphini]
MSVQAFRLVCAVDRELLPQVDKAVARIECLECCGHNLYLGTSDGFIHHLLLEERSGAMPGHSTFSASRQLQRQLGTKKPVNELRAASALNRLLVLCDGVISLVHMLNLEPVPSGARIKGAVTFTLNENPLSGDPFCVEVCIVSVKRRTIQLFHVYEDRVQILKEVSTPEQPFAVAIDGYFLCLALTTQYIILNYNTGASQDLFPYSSEEKRPIVKRIGRQEFLLAGPGGLGMFATVAGISQRAPVRWSENVIGATVCFPYVVALDAEFITVHSMLDQQKKQTLPFKDGHILQDFEGRVIVATGNGVYILTPLPLEKQIQDLLSNHRVEEALVLAKGARRNIPKEKFQVMYRRILQQAGFIHFAQLRFPEAKELFRSGRLDVRELISLYPFLLPTSATFTRVHPPLHEYADLNHLTQGDQEKMNQCKRFLMSYLNEIRRTEVANGCKEDIDTALLKLYAEASHENLLDLLGSENSCIMADSATWLEKYKKYFALGLLYHYHGQDAAALQKEKYHTHLAVLYLEEVLRLKAVVKGNCMELAEVQKKFQHLLQQSDFYRVHLLLDKIKDSDLLLEQAILYGKSEDHEKALNILVWQLKDFSTAEHYCLWNSENKDPIYKQRLFHQLLSVYLHSDRPDESLLTAAVDLLNHHAAEFNAAQVLRQVPDTWSAQLLSQFLVGAMRESVHRKRMSQLTLGLAKAENIIYQYEKLKATESSIVLSDKNLCQVCRDPFLEPAFVRYPNGSLVHTHCAASRHTNPSSTHHLSSPSRRT